MNGLTSIGYISLTRSMLSGNSLQRELQKLVIGVLFNGLEALRKHGFASQFSNSR